MQRTDASARRANLKREAVSGGLLPRESAKALAARLVKVREMSSGELRMKLTLKGVSEDVSEEVVANMIESGLIADEWYAVRIVCWYRQRGYGRSRIEFELQNRAVPREYWEDAFFNEDGALYGVDAEIEAAASIIDNYDLSGGLTTDIRRRIISALQRRGHSRDVIVCAFRSRDYYVSL